MKLSRRDAIKLGLTGVGGLLLPFELPNSALAETSSDCSNCLRGEIGSPTFDREELSHQIIRFQRPFQRPPLLKPVRSYKNKNTKIKPRYKKYQSLDSLGIKPGQKVIYQEVLVTEENKKKRFNVVVYWRRKYKNKQLPNPWYLLTNIENKEEVLHDICISWWH